MLIHYNFSDNFIPYSCTNGCEIWSTFKNDIMVHLDQGNRVALLLLDMSAAFDTLDHSTLLNRFNEEFGIIGKPLKWFESYFGERTQSVVIRGVKSEPVPLSQGVPQGSVIGPKAYTM